MTPASFITIIYSSLCLSSLSFFSSSNISGYRNLLKAYDSYRKYARKCNDQIRSFYKANNRQDGGGWYQREYQELLGLRQECVAFCQLAKSLNRGGSVKNIQWAIDYCDEHWERLLRKPSVEDVFNDIFRNDWISQFIVDADDLLDAFAINNDVDSKTQEKLRKSFLNG